MTPFDFWLYLIAAAAALPFVGAAALLCVVGWYAILGWAAPMRPPASVSPAEQPKRATITQTRERE